MIAAKRLVLSGADVFPVAEHLLREGLKVIFTVSGGSMWPLIRHNRDSVLLAQPSRPIRAGDIVLMHIPAPHDRYILHRIHHVSGDMCVTLGDGNLTVDPIAPLSCIIGRAEEVKRGKYTLRCDGTGFRLLSWWWRILLPIRRPLLRGTRVLVRFKRSMLHPAQAAQHNHDAAEEPPSE